MLFDTNLYRALSPGSIQELRAAEQRVGFMGAASFHIILERGVPGAVSDRAGDATGHGGVITQWGDEYGPTRDGEVANSAPGHSLAGPKTARSL